MIEGGNELYEPAYVVRLRQTEILWKSVQRRQDFVSVYYVAASTRVCVEYWFEDELVGRAHQYLQKVVKVLFAEEEHLATYQGILNEYVSRALTQMLQSCVENDEKRRGGMVITDHHRANSRNQ